jgi:hypothetical protein
MVINADWQPPMTTMGVPRIGIHKFILPFMQPPHWTCGLALQAVSSCCYFTLLRLELATVPGSDTTKVVHE